MSSFPTPTFARELFQKSPFSDGGFLDQLQEKHGLVEEEEEVIEKEVVVIKKKKEEPRYTNVHPAVSNLMTTSNNLPAPDDLASRNIALDFASDSEDDEILTSLKTPQPLHQPFPPQNHEPSPLLELTKPVARPKYTKNDLNSTSDSFVPDTGFEINWNTFVSVGQKGIGSLKEGWEKYNRKEELPVTVIATGSISTPSKNNGNNANNSMDVVSSSELGLSVPDFKRRIEERWNRIKYGMQVGGFLILGWMVLRR